MDGALTSTLSTPLDSGLLDPGVILMDRADNMAESLPAIIESEPAPTREASGSAQSASGDRDHWISVLGID